MKVLVACECSGTVRDAFISRGHEAMSCDLQDTVIPGPHYKGSVFDIIENGWDLMIAHPPCTHLAVSGAAWFEQKRKDGRQQQGIDLFMKFTKTNINKWCIENPVGIMSKLYRPYDQLIHPWMFGDSAQKATCLWLNNLQPLLHCEEDDLFFKKTHSNSKGEFIEWIDKKTGAKKRQAKWFADAGWARLKNLENGMNIRSKTFPGIAKAMALSWG